MQISAIFFLALYLCKSKVSNACTQIRRYAHCKFDLAQAFIGVEKKVKKKKCEHSECATPRRNHFSRLVEQILK